MRILFVVSILFLSGSECFCQHLKGFVIEGNLKGLKNGTFLYLVHNDDNKVNGADTVGRVRAKNGAFTFKGVLASEGEPYFIKIDTLKTKYQTIIENYVAIQLESKKIKIHGSITNLSLDSISVIGSRTHDEYVNFKKETRPMIDRANVFGKEKDRSSDSLFRVIAQRKMDSCVQVFTEYRKQWILSHPNSFISPWLIQWACRQDEFGRRIQVDTNNLIAFYNQLSPASKVCYFGKLLKKEITTIEVTSIGAIAPDFISDTPEGLALSLKEVISKGKLTLIDFWASWCRPCREEIPYLKRIYQTYHVNGLNILSVSLDFNDTTWRNTIIKDTMDWYHVSDNILQQNGEIKGKVSDIYGVTAIPMTFLVDVNGKIIAFWKGSSRDELEKIVHKLLL